MGKNSLGIIVVILLVAGILIYFQFKPKILEQGDTQITIGELTRELPLEVNPGETFNVIYSSDKVGSWGVIIVDSVSGGCKFQNGKTELKSVLLGEGSDSQVIEVTTPFSGSCTFSGDYNFGSDPIKNFPDQIVNIK